MKFMKLGQLMVMLFVLGSLFELHAMRGGRGGRASGSRNIGAGSARFGGTRAGGIAGGAAGFAGMRGRGASGFAGRQAGMGAGITNPRAIPGFGGRRTAFAAGRFAGAAGGGTVAVYPSTDYADPSYVPYPAQQPYYNMPY